jgi:hypothetical protein
MGVLPVAGREGPAFGEAERSGAVGAASGRQKQCCLHVALVITPGAVERLRDEHDLDVLRQRRIDDLTGDLGALAFVGRGERLVAIERDYRLLGRFWGLAKSARTVEAISARRRG